MSEPSSAELPYRQTAARLIFALLLVFAVVVVHAVIQHAGRAKLEDVAALTAVGDAKWYQVPAPEPNPPSVAVNFEGQALVPLSYRRIDLRDVRMSLAGEDDEHRLRIYTTREVVPVRPGETEHHSDPVFYLKVGVDQYLKVQSKAH